uniref:Membrane transporter protein n=1 Tax=Alexandrium monilatum TaxID=311494 RepID=A0A7S4PTR2_9DINO
MAPPRHCGRGTWLPGRRLALVAAGGASIAAAVADDPHVNATAMGLEVLAGTTGAAAAVGNRSETGAWVLDLGSFDYHKPAFPLDWHHDGLTILFSSLGLIIAASGGIGGGGILVPLFMLLLKFRPKHAIALSNFTILGGAIANTVVNARKRHPHLDRTLIDWDLILIMEPLTIFGAVFGSLLSKVLPNAVLTAMLVVILAFMGQRTLKKGLKMWREESGCSARVITTNIEMKAPDGESDSGNGHAPLAADDEADSGTADHYLELGAESDSEAAKPPAAASQAQRAVGFKITALTCCFVGTCALTILKGGGHFRSPLGFECGSRGFWVLYFGALPWVLGFAIYFRSLLVSEFQQKVRTGHVFVAGEVQWDSANTLRYPALCAISGLLAGLFGVGGGIVKGPLMLEMGIMPAVASASAAAMILFTSAAASISFVAFGLLHAVYGAMFFVLGIACTALGQYSVGQWVKRHERQSPIVLSIGLVIILSSVLVGVDMVAEACGPRAGEMLRAHGVCTAEA